MDGIERLISIIDSILNTDKKRHIAGGILMSASLLFASLAITVMTLKIKEDEYGQIYVE